MTDEPLTARRLADLAFGQATQASFLQIALVERLIEEGVLPSTAVNDIRARARELISMLPERPSLPPDIRARILRDLTDD